MKIKWLVELEKNLGKFPSLKNSFFHCSVCYELGDFERKYDYVSSNSAAFK